MFNFGESHRNALYPPTAFRSRRKLCTFVVSNKSFTTNGRESARMVIQAVDVRTDAITAAMPNWPRIFRR